MIAALYVDPAGPYFGRPDVDPWPEARDARLYAGPYPVVAHPPCERWGNFWWSLQNARGPDAAGLGQDGGCFKSALASVLAFGGVLEHPASSRAWTAFGLPRPTHGLGWVAGSGGWACSVDQANYGHRARKRSWLFFVGQGKPLDLDWSSATSRVWVASGPGGRTASERAAKGISLLSKSEKRLTPPVRPALGCSRIGVTNMSHRERRLTPAVFADALIGLCVYE